MFSARVTFSVRFCAAAALGVAALGLDSGCTSVPRSAWRAERTGRDLPFVVPANSPVMVAAARTVDLEPRRFADEVRRRDDFERLFGTPLIAPRLELAAAEGRSRGDRAGADAKDSFFSKDYWKLVGYDVKEVFTAPARWDTRDWLVLGGVVAGIGTVAVFDKDIQKAVQRSRARPTDDIFKAVQPFGAEYSIAVLAGFYVGGEVFKDPRAKSVALDGLSASIIASGLIDLPLKYTLGRGRPTKHQATHHFAPFGGDDSFPSGHATQAFAVATVIAEHYDSLWIKTASYGLASMVGYGRLNHNEHWASDVLAGAAIGTFVGHVVVHFNQHHRHFLVTPIIGPHTQGAELTWAF